MARVGKIARLPEPIREEVNKRLRSGQLGPQLLPWLNAQPEVKAVLGEFFDGARVNAQNLSDWRNGGYEEWLEKQDRHYQRLERTRELATMSMRLAQANGGSLSEGASTILGGEILDLLEGIEDLKSPTEGNEENEGEKLTAAAEALDKLAAAVARLRSGDQNNVVLRQNDRRIEQKDEDLRQGKKKLELLEIKACEAMLSAAVRRRAEEIANSDLSNADKIAAMRAEAFKDVDALEKSGEVQLPG